MKKRIENYSMYMLPEYCSIGFHASELLMISG